MSIRKTHTDRAEPTSIYQCSCHRSHGPDACAESRTYVQREVETAALGVVRNLLASAELQEEFVAALNEERMTTIEGMRDRRSALEASVRDLHRQIVAEMEGARRMEGFPDEMVVLQRKNLTERYQTAQAELAAMPEAPETFVRDDERVDDILATFDRFANHLGRPVCDDGMEPLPADEIEEAEARAVAAFKRLVSKVHCIPFPESRSFMFSVDVRIGRLMTDAEGADGIDLGIRTFEGICHPPHRKGNTPLTPAGAVAALVQSGRYNATEAEHALLASLLPDSVVGDRDGALDRSAFVDALMYCLRTGLSPASYGAAFGPVRGEALRLAFKRFVYGGYWMRVRDALLRADPDAGRDLAMKYFDGLMVIAANYPYRRRERGFMSAATPMAAVAERPLPDGPRSPSSSSAGFSAGRRRRCRGSQPSGKVSPVGQNAPP